MRHFALAVGISFVFLGMFTWVFAQETVPLTPTPSPSPIEYVLPYPGILPDHPLYFLKQLRDKILGIFITKPVRKIEFYILNADKRLNMATALLDKKKESLALKTAQESAGFLAKAEVKLFEIPAGSDLALNSVKDRFGKSLAKHIEILNADNKRISSDNVQGFTKVIEELERLQQDFNRRK